MSSKIKCFRLKDEFCGESCCMTMINVPKEGYIVGKGGLLYSNDGTNSYLLDPRKRMFPYSEIPIHLEKSLFKKNLMVNQILTYDNIYTLFRENDYKNFFVTKTKGGVILAMEPLSPFGLDTKSVVVDREGLDEILSSNDDEDTLIISSGKKVQPSIVIPSIDEVITNSIQSIRSRLEETNNLRTFQCESSDIDFSSIYYFNMLDKLDELTNSDSKSISFDLPVVDDFFIVKTLKYGNGVSISKVHIAVENRDKYRVDITPISGEEFAKKYANAIENYLANPSRIEYIKDPVFDSKLDLDIPKVLKKTDN